MPETLIHPPRTILEVWESLPEGTLCQIINDKLVMSPAPIILHQIVLNEINFGILNFLKKHSIGKVLIAPVDVHFSSQNILQPDILFIKNENLSRIKTKGLYGAPDVIIEILSPSTSSFDNDDKKMIYERFDVQEYFIVDPNSKLVNAFYLIDGQYKEQTNSKGKIKSVVLNTEIKF